MPSTSEKYNPWLGTSSPGLRNSINDQEAVLANNFETLHPLPPELEDLPLYLDHDGFYSVNDPEFHTNYNEHPTTYLLDNQTSNPASKNPNTSSNLHQLPVNAINKLDTRLCAPFSQISLPASSPQPQPSPQASHRGKYICNEPGCIWQFPFQTKQALARHHEAKHLQKRLDCPFPGCESVGSRGIKRKDNLRAHIWNQHRVELLRESHRS